MYLILVYDIGVERLPKVLNTCRRYLTWIQNSVFEGEITEANFLRLKHQLSKIIDDKNDSIVFYLLRTTAYLKKEVIGTIKGEATSFF
jgi:CRISPR-associated protein Cas2